MGRAGGAGLAYALLAFAAGFALGLIRVPLLVPRFGELAALALEAPFLLLACAFAARSTALRFAVAPSLAPRLVQGGVALALLLTIELGVPWLMQGRAPAEQLAARAPAPLALFGLLLLAFAAMPALVLRWKERLFSYGTLQLESVQLATFGRRLAGKPDALVGFRLGQLAIRDAEVVRTSGVSHHPIVHATGDDADRVPGVVFEVTPAELAQADAYETDDYARLRVRLASGTRAWVYAAALAAAGAQAVPIVDARTDNYLVRGATEAELAASLAQRPRAPNGRPQVGVTHPAEVRWQFEARERKGRCLVVSVRVTLTAVTTLPRWDAPPAADGALRMRWDRFLGALTAHEQGHVDIALDAAKRIEQALWDAPAPRTCTGFRAQLDATANALFDQAVKAQEEYDATTDFGRTQGVAFP